jgi:GT2 family glycosyltransferase
MKNQQQRILENNRRVLQRMQSENDTLMVVEQDKTWFPPHPMKPKFDLTRPIVDVIIPSKTCGKTLPMIINCIRSLRASEDKIQFNVVIVESGEQVIDMGQNITIQYPKARFCYNHALNMGISKTTNNWVVMANNDLIFKPGWMHEIIIARNLRKDIESFSPWNDMWDWHSRYYGNMYPAIIEGYRIGVELAGWCIVARRRIFEKVKLSERVNFWYSDNVYADDLMRHGIKHALVTSSKVDHIVSQTHIVSAEESYASKEEYLNNTET